MPRCLMDGQESQFAQRSPSPRQQSSLKRQGGGVRKSMGLIKQVKKLLSKDNAGARGEGLESMVPAGAPSAGPFGYAEAGPWSQSAPADGTFQGHAGQALMPPALDLSKPPAASYAAVPSPATAQDPLACQTNGAGQDAFMIDAASVPGDFIVCTQSGNADGRSSARASPNAAQAFRQAQCAQQQRLNAASCPPIAVTQSPLHSPSAAVAANRAAGLSPLAGAGPSTMDPFRAASYHLSQTRSLESEVHLSPPVSGRAARHGSGMIPVPGMMLPSPASGRLSSWASGGLSPSLRRGSISSTTLRQHISLKGLLNLDSYDFVPDVDVSRAQQEVDSSEDECEMDEDRGSAATTTGQPFLYTHAHYAPLPTQFGPDGVTPLMEQDAHAAAAAAAAAANVAGLDPALAAAAAAAASGGMAVPRSMSQRLAAQMMQAEGGQPRSLPALPMGNAFARPAGAPLPPHGSAFGQPQPADADWRISTEQQAAGGAAGAAAPMSDIASHASAGTLEHAPSARLFGAASINSEAMTAASVRNSLTSMNMDIEELMAMHAQHQGAFFMQEVFKEKQSNILAVSPALPRGMRRSMWSVNDFKLHKCLHKGYASHVYAADCKTTGLKVVLKVYRLAAQCDLQRVQLYREICVHSRLQHQNIIQFYSAFLEDNCVIIVQEFAEGGDLLRYMYKAGGRLSERQAVEMVLQPFLAALQYLHTQGIIHRDIKPENCLLTEDKVLKLADFGLAVDLRAERANTRAGTLDYMAPEVLRCPTKETPDQFKSAPDAAHYEMGADAWAVGVFAYELVVGGPPFKAEQMIDTARNIMGGKVAFPQELSQGAVDFITACLRKHPGDRPTVMEMLRLPWINIHKRRQSVVMPGMMHGAAMGSVGPMNQAVYAASAGGTPPALNNPMFQQFWGHTLNAYPPQHAQHAPQMVPQQAQHMRGPVMLDPRHHVSLPPHGTLIPTLHLQHAAAQAVNAGAAAAALRAVPQAPPQMLAMPQPAAQAAHMPAGAPRPASAAPSVMLTSPNPFPMDGSYLG